jgi:predicted small lipoprotein YifL
MRGGALACLVLALMLMIPASCGKKGDLFLPQKSTNARVVDLKGAWQEGYIELKGSVQAPSGPDSAVTGSRVYYAVYPVAEPPCDGCPIEYQGFHTYGPEVVREGRFFCKIPGAVKGNIYYFEVQLAGAKGGLGPASNRAKVVVD